MMPMITPKLGYLGQPLNLLGNATKFTDEGAVELRVERRGGVVHFQVSDSGIGIAEESAGKLFEPFVQDANDDQHRRGGTGLGLAICKRLVDAMGGRIAAERRPEGGSLFWFEAPLGVGDPADIQDPGGALPDPDPDIGSRSVLIVEDNEVNAIVAEAFLEGMGHTSVVVGRGVDAVDAVERGDFDAVLMDVSLPDIDGLEATRRIRALDDPAHRAIPIIAMSAHVFASEINEHIAAGMDMFVGKPVSPERLADALRAVFLPESHEISHRRVAAGGDIVDRLADPSVLRDDFAALGERRTSRMVDAFLRDGPARLDILVSAVDENDCQAAGDAAHALKSAAGQLGLLALESRCRALEESAKRRDIDDMAARGDGLPDLFEQSRAYIESAMRDLSKSRPALGASD